MRILLVEDEIPLAEAVAQILKKNKYQVDMVHEGDEGLDYGLSGIYDLIILDIMLPKVSGLEILKAIRKNKMMVPVLLLTAKGSVEDKVKGLDYGADDYLAKPFAKEELLARIRALSRRKADVIILDELEYGDIVLNTSNLMLTSGPKEIKLTLRECELLEFFIARNKMVSSKELIIEKLWGYDSDAEDNHVEVYVSFIRKKLKFLKSDVRIVTTRGVGYSLEEK